jgi:23S rRNA (guanosine2251-2'-O)-methyltransferase
MNDKTPPIYLYGRNAIQASLESGHVKTLYVSLHNQDDALALLAKAKGLPVMPVDEGKLTQLAQNPAHQGFVALAEGYGTFTIEELIQSAKSKAYPLIALLDGIEDPHNLGAVLRSADAFGVDGLIIKNHGEVQLNGTVAKVSTGAINFVKVAVVANLSQAMEILKKNGYWIVATDGSATQSYTEIDYRCPIGLIVGSEGFGIAPLVLKRSDFIVKIPMSGHVNSLNASVVAGILFAHIVQSRR